ncbi:MAG: selenocysteine-specific translation elongation factor [Euzebya sp.]
MCTAGHVDHGKSTLVNRLTGTNPDRLAEEKQRGLTIDLGFAWTSLDGVGQVAFVDLPGHERFVANMLAGAGPAQVALFVVAADEGWMPQSAEHLDILQLLDFRHGVIAVTRTDLVDPETAEIAIELVRDEVAGTGLAQAPIVGVSAVTGAGIDQLTDILGTVLRAAGQPRDEGRPRLWIDRAFSITGAGTVVTGTLTGGAVAVGDRIRVWPDGIDVRVRGAQVLGRSVKHALPGSRVALNLVGVDVSEVRRGRMLGDAEQWVTTSSLDAWCLPAPGQTIARRGAWKIHVGTATTVVSLYPANGQDLDRPGGVRIRLDHPLALAAGDRFVLRDSGTGGTAGGGQVLDPLPGPRPRGRDSRNQARSALTDLATARTPAERLTGLVAHHLELDRHTALAMAQATPDDIDPSRLRDLGDFLMAPSRWTVLSGLALQAVIGTHQRRPALTAVDPAVPRQLLLTTGAAQPVADAVIAGVVRAGRLEHVRGGLRAPGHEPRLSMVQQAARTDLLARLDFQGLESDPLADLAAATGADEDLLDALAREAEIVLLDGGARAISRQIWVHAAATLRTLQSEVGAFTASQARDALATSRKFVLPLLEALDAAKVTRRSGDTRVVVDRNAERPG